jgi:dTDP-4-dehydrorhamnose 3,5-epimerase
MGLEGPVLVHGDTRRDERGEFSRLFCDLELAPLRADFRIRQVNLSRTARRGTVRGLHFQAPPCAEAKLIRCLRGKVFDVAVDLRRDSPGFLRWQGIELAAGDGLALYLPEGFAHGFQALSDECELLYMHTAPYSPAHEAGVRHDDPALAIAWPLSPVMLSPRDLSFASIDDAFPGAGA